MAQDEAITVFKVQTGELNAAFTQVDRLYNQLESRVDKVETKQKTWSQRVLQDMEQWVRSIINVRTVVGGLVGVLNQAAEANRQLLQDSTDAVTRRDLAFEPFLRHANIARDAPQASSFRTRFSALAEQYSGSFEQVSTLASELVSQGFSVDEMRLPTGALEQSIQMMIAGGEWQKGAMGTESARAVARVLTGFGLGKTGANVRRFGRAYYGLRETSLTLEGLQRFAEDAPAIAQVTGDDMESTMAMYSVLADTMAAAQGSTGYRQVVNMLTGAGASKKKRDALDSLGLTARQVDFIGDRIEKGEGADGSAMYTVIRLLADAKATMAKQPGGAEKFNVALTELFGTRTSTAARVFIEDAIEKFPARLADVRAANADADYTGAVRSGVTGPSALLRRAREVEQRQLDDPKAAQTSAMAKFAYAAARKRGVPEILARNFEEKFLSQITSVWGTDQWTALQKAVISNDPWEKQISNLSFGEIFKWMGAQSHKDSLKAAAAEAFEQATKGGLTFKPTSAAEATRAAMLKETDGFERFLIEHGIEADEVAAGAFGDPTDTAGTVANVRKLVGPASAVLKEKLPERFVTDGKLDEARVEKLHPEWRTAILNSAILLAKARSSGNAEQTKFWESWLDNVVKKFEAERKQRINELDFEAAGHAQRALRGIGDVPTEKRLQEAAEKARDEWKGSGVSPRRSLQDAPDGLAALIDALRRPQRIRVEFGGAVTPTEKTVEAIG